MLIFLSIVIYYSKPLSPTINEGDHFEIKSFATRLCGLVERNGIEFNDGYTGARRETLPFQGPPFPSLLPGDEGRLSKLVYIWRKEEGVLHERSQFVFDENDASPMEQDVSPLRRSTMQHFF